MKRTILTIAGTLTLLLAGCSDSGDDAANTSATAAEETPSATESATTESTEPSSSEEAEPQPTLDRAAPAPAPTDSDGGAPGDGGGNPGSGGAGGNGGGHPFGTPVESGPCSLDEILHPGMTAEGKHVVCIRDTVNDDRGVWVDGPPPTGQIVREGDPCDDGYSDNPQAGDKGAQDADGKIMLCAGDKWVYGP